MNNHRQLMILVVCALGLVFCFLAELDRSPLAPVLFPVAGIAVCSFAIWLADKAYPDES